MQLDLPTLCLLHADPELNEKLRAWLRSSYRIRQFGDWHELHESVRRFHPNSIALVDPYKDPKSDGTPSLHLRGLLSAFPTSPIIAACRFTPERVADAALVAEWGVAEILDLPRELTSVALERRLNSAAGFRMRSVLSHAFPGVLPSRTRALLEIAGDVVARGGTAPDFAARLNTGERTLNRWCAKMHLPEPRRLLAWLRILLAADMLSEGDRSVAAVARACGYASDSSLRNAFRMVGKTTPADVKTKGFRTTVAIPFARELSDIREQPDTATRAKSYLN